MNTCHRCHRPLPDSGRFCPACGVDRTAVPAGDMDETITLDGGDETIGVPVGDAPTRTVGLAAAGGAGSRFIPGAMITDRYRIVGLLGKGGMGEVYRADDLKLGQPVALKFLPPGLENDPLRLERFLSEVRTARQVTNSNVCRVYDVDEFEGQHFLSMEYVDGEDLASLLRRIGRLPQERAVEVARQICAGLAAAHDQGILHRDLKPANVMIDGRGRVRLTDFGLAALAEEISRDEVGVGTPAYMAPEAIAGREVTVRSDIYGLGLVLYEVFTGRRAFEAGTVAEIQRMHTSSMPSNLTEHVTDLDPTVEAAVLRCLEKNPADRPGSVLAVSAALPGGDPLAAALSAGETPSPELVAEAGERAGMAPLKAIALALATMGTLLVGSYWAGTMTITGYLPLEKRPEVLEDRARGIIAELGYVEDVYARPVDTAWGMITWYSVIAEAVAADTTAQPWEALRTRPDAASYWYRQSTRIMLPTPTGGPIFSRGPVQMTNPQPTTGDVTVLLDAAGRLRRFQVMPTRYSLADSVSEADWGVLFALAGLDTARFVADRPRYQRSFAPDRRRAWFGTSAERPDLELRVEAGSYEGRPVLFNVATSASLVSLGDPPVRQEASALQVLDFVVQPALILLVVIVSTRLASGNLRRGRTDRRGALRFGVLTFGLHTLGTALASHAIFTRQWASEIWPIIVGGCFVGIAVWSLYSAVEPVGRQVWPTMFVSSSRLLSRPRVPWRDPLIGKSVLIGLLAGGIDFLVQAPLRKILAPLWSDGNPVPYQVDLSLLRGQRPALGFVLDQAMLFAFLFVLVAALVLTRKLIRRRLPSLALALILWTVIAGNSTPEGLAFSFFTSLVMMVVLLRWGVVAMVVSRLALHLAWQGRVTDWTAWYSQGPLILLLALMALAAYGAWAAMGGRREQA